MEARPYLAIDCETTSTDFRRGARPFFISMCDEGGETRGWRAEVDCKTREVYWPYHYKQEVQEYLDSYIPVFHNAKFDIKALESIGLHVDISSYEDTLLASHAISSIDKHGLKELAVKYLRYTDTDELKLQKAVCRARLKAKKLGWTLGVDRKGTKQPKWDYWMPEQIDSTSHELRKYAFGDVERTILLWGIYKELLEAEDLMKGYRNEKELQKVVMKVENNGITLSKDRISAVSSFLSRNKTPHLGKMQFVAKKCFKKEINPDSNDDLKAIIYEDFGLEVLKRTEKGAPSLDKEALKELYEKLEEGTYEYKFMRHLLTSKAYVSGVRYLAGYKCLLHDLCDEWGVLYASFNQSGTGTSRFSSSNPNGQNIGKKTKYTVGAKEIYVPKLREVFGPLPGYRWLSLDYSQIELRIFAVVSGEQGLIDALNAGYDFHGYVASRIFNKSMEEVTDQERTIAKNVNFALIFGAGEAKVNATAGIDNAYELFANQFPNAHAFMAKVIKEVRETGYVRTLDGYRLSIPYETPYKAVNYLVQGSAGRIIKQAMLDLDKELDWQDATMIMQIHDELIFNLRGDSEYNSPKFVRRIMDIMEDSGRRLGVNTPVSAEIIDTDWGHGIDCEVTESQFILAA